MTERLQKAIKAFEEISGYEYYHRDSSYYQFFSYHHNNIAFTANGEIHVAKGDMYIPDELRKEWGWHRSKQSLGVYLMFSSWLKPMEELIAAIKAEEKTHIPTVSLPKLLFKGYEEKMVNGKMTVVKKGAEDGRK